jgi:hypothetical protein
MNLGRFLLIARTPPYLGPPLSFPALFLAKVQPRMVGTLFCQVFSQHFDPPVNLLEYSEPTSSSILSSYHFKLLLLPVNDALSRPKQQFFFRFARFFL